MWQNNEPPLIEEVGSSGYTAPEIFTQQGYNSKIDVWSFGVVLWELASRCPQDRINAFMGMAGEEFVKKAKHGCRPQLAHPHQLCLRPVIEKCWRFDPSERPTMDEVVLELEALCSEL
ncbi:unnamed protein product [Phytophthora lilii]|uniref:Unnamed protein product n=1 Tax=Phytophthora lilii TaxID=2077276 RepID=A0A9W7CWJ6_9STRA|nr:unnamed protein product [Phytophthora lilii]